MPPPLRIKDLARSCSRELSEFTKRACCCAHTTPSADWVWTHAIRINNAIQIVYQVAILPAGKVLVLDRVSGVNAVTTLPAGKVSIPYHKWRRLSRGQRLARWRAGALAC